MLAGHFATALVALQRAPTRRFPAFLLAWYLAVSQLPDLLWLLFHALGLEPTRPTDLFDVTLQDLSADMMFSHDLLPIVGWGVIFGLLGAVVFGDRRVGLATVVLVWLHALIDYLGGYPHHVFGPETPVVGTGLYLTLPFLAITLEAVYIVFFLVWFFIEERRRGVERSPGNRWTIIGLFVFNLAFLASIAVTSMRDRFGLPEFATPFNTTIPSLVVTYVVMGVLLWAVVRRGPSLERRA
ncbi:MAG: hypothetical protein RIA71_14270 [Oceanicaulis sp.]